MFKSSRRKRNEQHNGSMSFLSTLATVPSSKPLSTYSIVLVREILQPVGMWVEWHRNKAIPSHVCCGFPQFTLGGGQSWDNLRADPSKSAEKQGFQFTVRDTANSAQSTIWTLSCTHNIIFEDKACKCNYENGDAQFAEGMKVTTVKENH
jgi:hypothetical protein